MKFFFFITIFVSMNLYSYNKVNVNKTVGTTAEDIITKLGFTLLSKDIQNETLKEQATKSETGSCLDDSCLIDTGKMLAAKRLFVIKIVEIKKDNYMFKISYINLETDTNLFTSSKLYNGSLDDSKKLFNFSKEFLSSLKRSKKVVINNKKKIPAMFQIIFQIIEKDESNKKEYKIEFKTKYDPVKIYDGVNLLGKSPNSFNIKEGLHTFIFEKDGYLRAERKIKVNRDISIKHISFKKAITLIINSRIKDATIYINGVDRGELNNGKLKLNLAIGKYEIVLDKNGKKIHKTIDLNKNTSIQFYDFDGPFPIKIKTDTKSKLFYNKKLIGFTPQVIELKKGEHKIRLYNKNSGYKEFDIKVIKPDSFSFNMSKSFKYIDLSLKSSYIYTDFPFQRESSHTLLGVDLKLFNWSWKSFDIDIIGGGFYFGLNDYKMFKFHLFNINYKPIKNLKINIAIGPLLGNFINLYDNIQDSYNTYGGIKIEYNKIFNNIFYLKVESSLYFGNKNSKNSFYSENNNDMDNGFLFSTSLGVGILY